METSSPSPTPPRVSTFRTAELPEAAYLLLRAVKLLDVEKGFLGSLSVFIFEPSGAVVVREYHDGATAPCRDYALAMQSAKRAMFSGTRR